MKLREYLTAIIFVFWCLYIDLYEFNKIIEQDY